MKLVYIFVITIISTCAYADEMEETTTVTYSVYDKLIRCSNGLSSFIKSLCHKDYNIIKRDISSVLVEKLMPEGLKIVNARQWHLHTEHWKRVRRQLAEECCDRICTVGNIIWYCSDGSKLVLENPELFNYL